MGRALCPLRGGGTVTLKELSKEYAAAAVPVRRQLRVLRQKLSQTKDPEKRWQIQRKIAVLNPILTQLNELTELLDRYYERGYYRNEKYTL
jgi:hypothetical protein